MFDDSDYGNWFDSAYTAQRVDGRHPYAMPYQEGAVYNDEDHAAAMAFADMRAANHVDSNGEED